MAKIKEFIDEKYQGLKLAYSKGLTSLGLKLVTRNKKVKGICVQKNIEYGTDKRQKYDLIYRNYDKPTKVPLIFYVHGGSWCGGDKYGYTMYCSKFAKQDYAIVNINYRLMPKVGIRTVILDCINAMKHFTKNSKKIFRILNKNISIDFDHAFMIGDSAGAHIISLIAGRKNLNQLKLNFNISALGLYYGVFDFRDIEHDPSPIMTDLDKYWKTCEKGRKKLYKDMSSTLFVTSTYPPCFVTSGEIDKLHHQTELMVEALKQNNVDFDYLSFAKNRFDGSHAFLNVLKFKSSIEAFEHISNFFNKHRGASNGKEW